MILNESNFNFLNEAEFKRENIAKVMQLYRKLFGKYFGGEFKIISEETYKKIGEKGSGIRLINDLNYQLRFNWKLSDSNALLKQSRSDKTKLYISSIDYWEPTNLDFERPSATITFLVNVNVVQIWKGLAKVIKKGVRGKYTFNDLKVDASDLTESKSIAGKSFKDFIMEDWNLSKDQQADFLIKHAGFNNSKAKYQTSAKEFNRLIKDSPDLANKLDEYCIELNIGKKETNSTGENLRKAEKELEQMRYCDPQYLFQDIEDITELVAKGKLKAFMVCGMAGIGKTFSVTKKLKEILGEQPGPWYYHSGMKASPVSFYMKTFEERKSIIVWDEADSLLTSDDISMMLKPALDTSGDNTMEYSRGRSVTGMSKEQVKALGDEIDAEIANGKTLGLMNKGEFVQVPGKFYFEGSMIFISNMPAKKIDSAILSRCVYIDAQLSASDVSKRIMSIMKLKYPNYSDAELEEFANAMGGLNTSNEPVQYMTPEYARKIKGLSIRSMCLAVVMKEAGLKNWARLASLYA